MAVSTTRWRTGCRGQSAGSFSSAGRLDQVDAAPFRQSLQLAQAAISEADRRARQELPGRPRGIDLARLSQVCNPRRNVHRRAADVTALQLDLAGWTAARTSRPMPDAARPIS